MRWTQSQFENYILKRNKWQGDLLQPETPDPGKEEKLQSKCESWLKDHGYPYFHDRSRKKNQAGIPDLICFLPEGRCVIIELKAKEGRLTKEQQQILKMLKWLKHEVYEVRSFKRFLEVMNHGL
ncbi:MAG: VRR-NUC domain-containing protein [Pseudomonadota bacterium]